MSKPQAVRGYTHVTAAGLVLANHLGSGASMGDPPSPSEEANRCVIAILAKSTTSKHDLVADLGCIVRLEVIPQRLGSV